MKRPTLSHCLAYRPSLAPNTLRTDLIHSRANGYVGMILVAALMDKPAQAYIDVFKEVGATAVICGFNAGNGPDPLNCNTSDAALANLRSQMQIAVEFASKGVGPDLIVGPMHTWHKHQRDVWDLGPFNRWMDLVQETAEEFDLVAAFEPLNSIEDGTPDAFETVIDAVVSRQNNMAIHWDTAHAHSRKKHVGNFHSASPHIRLLEWTNVGRNPLAHTRGGIDYAMYAEHHFALPASCVQSTEPFDPSVIEAFGLQEICDTTTSGRKCLESDARFLIELGVMKEVV